MVKSNEFYEEIDKLKKKTNNERIQKLEEELKEDEEYFNDNEKDRIEAQETINKSNRLNDELNKENQKINKELNNKKN